MDVSEKEQVPSTQTLPGSEPGTYPMGMHGRFRRRSGTRGGVSVEERANPFPGPRPYRTEESDRFLGREVLTELLGNSILAHPCVTLFGPSGAGKSSLMRAGVVPLLEEEYGFRTVSVDTWLTGEVPLERLARAMFAGFELGEVPAGMGLLEALDEALRWAERASARPILIYLDQLEQLLLPDRKPQQVGALMEGLERLARTPLQGLQLVLALREDYLGRFRDRARGRRALWEQSFRLGPLTVGEMVRVACRLAELGEPAQRWEEGEVRRLMLQVRAGGQAETDEAEVQTAFAQIVCRALWEERKKGGVAGPVDAEPILHRYLESTLRGLGPLEADARRLLEEHLVASDGTRTLLMEEQARAVLPEGAAEKVLTSLERAAVLRAEEHRGSRYFELGHDWLARKVLEFKRAEQRRRQREHATRRKLAILAAVATGVALVMGILLLWALSAQRRAFDQFLMAGAREQMELGQPAVATRLLLEAKQPAALKGWTALAQEALESNYLELTLHGSGQPLNAAAYSPDGQLLVMGANDGSVQLWRADGSAHTLLGTHEGAILTAAFSPDGRRIVTASEDGTARVWSVDEPGRPFQLGTRSEQARSAAFSPDGQRIVVASRDKTARVWRADGSGEPLVLRGHQEPLTSAAFSPDGKLLVTTSWDGTARVWHADGSGPLRVLTGHKGPVLSAAFSPDSELLVTGSDDGTARVWRVNSSEEPFVLEGHEGPVRSVAFSPENPEPDWSARPRGKDLRIVTASDDATARVWWANGSREPLVLEGHEGPVRSAAFSPDGQRLVTASWDGTARVWRVEDAIRPRMLRGHEQPVTFAAFSPDGRFIATASRDRTVKLWNSDGSGPVNTFKGHTGPVMSVAFSPDGQRLVTASRDKTARVWRLDGSKRPIVLTGHTDDVSSAEFSPDGEHIVTASWDRTVRVWNADGTGTPMVLTGHKGRVNAATFSPDGQYILTADSTGTVRQWRSDGLGPPLERVVHGLSVTSARYSPDGKRILTASEDGTARMWRADLSEELAEFKGHKGPVYFADFSPGGLLVVTASNDGTARVWRADDPKQFSTLEAHGGPVYFAAFSPNGERILTASWDKNARLWSLPISALQSIKVLQQRLAQGNLDCLSADLRQTYFGQSEDEARKGYELCERSHGRTPMPATSS